MADQGYSFGEYTPTWDEVLSKASEEELYEALGVPLDEKLFCSPFREDKNPTCTMWRSPKGRLYFRDWAVGDTMSVFKLTEYVYGCSEEQALRILYDIAKGVAERPEEVRRSRPGSNIKHKTCEIRVKRRTWTASDYEWWSQFGITASTLKLYRVDPLEMAWFNDNVVFQHPYGIGWVYDFFDHDYKLYFPNKTKYRFLHNRADILQGYDQLPETGEYLIVTKSLKDVMHFKDVWQIPAVAPMAETVLVPQAYEDELRERFDKIIVFLDNDLPGVRAMKPYKARGYQVCMIPRRFGSKDVTDFYKQHGFYKLKGLITQAKQHYFES